MVILMSLGTLSRHVPETYINVENKTPFSSCLSSKKTTFASSAMECPELASIIPISESHSWGSKDLVKERRE